MAVPSSVFVALHLRLEQMKDKRSNTHLIECAAQIQTVKVDIKAQSKIGSMDNVKHRPGGGAKKIFDDKDYLKNVDHPVAVAGAVSPQPLGGSGSQSQV